MKKPAWFLIGLFVLCAIAMYFLWPGAHTAEDHSLIGETKTDRIQQFLPADWSVASSSVQVLEAIYLPFLHSKFVKKKVRVGQIKGPGIAFSGPKSRYTNSQITRGTVVLLADTDQLLRIELQGDVPTGPFFGQMPLAAAEEYYRSVREKYFGLPEDIPTLRFRDVINHCYQNGLGQVEKAARIEAAYVMQAEDRRGATPTAKWIINFYGIPPYPAFGVSNASVEERSYLRYRLNDVGKFLSCDSLP